MDPSTSRSVHKQRTQRTLPELMATLPQELYDQIYDEVITTYPQAVVVSGSPGKPFARPMSSLLQVSRGVREHVLSSYYANTIFVCPIFVYEVDEFLAEHFPEGHLSERRIRSIWLYVGECRCSGCRSRMMYSSSSQDEWRIACGDQTEINAYPSFNQLCEELEREGIKIKKMA